MLLKPSSDEIRGTHLAARARSHARLARAVVLTAAVLGLSACAVKPRPVLAPQAVAEPEVLAEVAVEQPLKPRRVPMQRAKPSDPAAGDFLATYGCGLREITIGWVGVGMRLTDGADVYDLQREPNPSEMAFKGEGLLGSARVVLKGIHAEVTVNGRALRPCIRTHQWPMNAFRATGHSPSWLLKGEAEVLHWTVADKLFSTRLTDDVPLALAQPLQVGSEPGSPVVSVNRRVCRDAESGMPHPYTVDVAYDGQTLKGCGGEPLALLTARTWIVTGLGASPADAASKAVPLSPLGHEVTLQFDGKGRVSGVAHCNRFTGIYALTGSRLSIGSVVATKRACTGSAMQDEQVFLKMLATIEGFDVSANGLVFITRDAAERGQRTGIWTR